MSKFLEDILSNQPAVLAVLLGTAGIVFVAVVLIKLRQSRPTPPPSTSVHSQTALLKPALVVGSAALIALLCVMNGTAIYAYLTSDHQYLRIISANQQEIFEQLQEQVRPDPEVDTRDIELRNQMAAIECDLLELQGSIKISGMDECITGYMVRPEDIYRQIVGSDIGSAWTELSVSEKQIAIDRTKEAAEVHKQTMAFKKAIGLPVNR